MRYALHTHTSACVWMDGSIYRAWRKYGVKYIHVNDSLCGDTVDKFFQLPTWTTAVACCFSYSFGMLTVWHGNTILLLTFSPHCTTRIPNPRLLWWESNSSAIRIIFLLICRSFSNQNYSVRWRWSVDGLCEICTKSAYRKYTILQFSYSDTNVHKKKFVQVTKQESERQNKFCQSNCCIWCAQISFYLLKFHNKNTYFPLDDARWWIIWR